MVIDIVAQNLELSDGQRKRISQKFSQVIEKYLSGLKEDLKKATVSVQKLPRFGFLLKFDMQLPWTHIYAQLNSPLMFVGVIGLREKVARQIRQQAEKMKDKRK